MKFLIRLVLSLEKLVKNPVKWFDHQPWLFRTMLVLLLIPLISSISIISYQKISLKNNSDHAYQELTQEMSEMRQDLEKFHDSQLKEISYLSEDIARLKQTSTTDTGESVLGAQDLGIEENLRQRLQDTALTEGDAKLAYIKTDTDKEVVVFDSPNTASQRLAILETGSFYPALTEKDDWQQISLSDEQIGWVKKEFIIKFPINENN